MRNKATPELKDRKRQELKRRGWSDKRIDAYLVHWDFDVRTDCKKMNDFHKAQK